MDREEEKRKHVIQTKRLEGSRDEGTLELRVDCERQDRLRQQ